LRPFLHGFIEVVRFDHEVKEISVPHHRHIPVPATASGWIAALFFSEQAGQPGSNIHLRFFLLDTKPIDPFPKLAGR